MQSPASASFSCSSLLFAMIMLPRSDSGSGLLECIFGESVANRPCTTEWIVSFNSADVGSDSSNTCLSQLAQSQIK